MGYISCSAEEADPRADSENEWPFLCEPLPLEVTPKTNRGSGINEQGKRTRGINHLGVKEGEAVPLLEEPRPEPQTRPAAIAKGNDIMMDWTQNDPKDSKSNDELPKREAVLKPRVGGFQKNRDITIDHSPIHSWRGENQRSREARTTPAP
ncbi:hypothetical protein AOLI_G00170580 [Acnodon oligacanthus]